MTETLDVARLRGAIDSLAHGRCCWDAEQDASDLAAEYARLATEDAKPIALVEDQERPLIWIAPRAEGLTERLATAMNLAYTYVGRDGEPTLPFVDDLEAFWEPFAWRVVEALEP